MAATDSKLSTAAQQSLGLPSLFKTYSPYPFAGMNVQASPVAMADEEFLWLENFARLGDGNLRAIWDVGTPLYTAPGGLTIVRFFFYTIGSTFYCAVFLSDGSAVQVNVMDGATMAVGPPGTFYNAASGLVPACSQWGAQYLIISNANTVNDYWIWDGSLLYTAGTVAPNGVILTAGGYNYNTVPQVTAIGGHGTGLVLTPVISDGSVVQVNIEDPGSGYELTDTVLLAFSGGGSNSGAILQAVLEPTSVAAVIVTDGGEGYTEATVTLGVFGSGSIVTSVAITGPAAPLTGGVYNPGSPPTISFSGGGGSGAAAVPVMQGYGSGPFSAYEYVSAVLVTNGGSGYSGAPTVTFSPGVRGNTATGAAIISAAPTVGTAVATIANGIESVTVTNGGRGYSTASVSFVGGGGSGAVATVVISSAGTIVAINVTSAGSGYSSAPTVLISGNGTGAEATAAIQNGAITAITVTNGGSGYTDAFPVAITGNGRGATAVMILVATGVASVYVLNPGSGYINVPELTFVGGGGTGAVAVATLAPTGLASINVVGGGAGFQTAPTLTIYGNAGSSNPTTTVVIQNGAAVSVVLSGPGSGFTAPPYCTDNGTGSPTADAAYQAVLVPTEIASVAISNPGTGYSSAPQVQIGGGANYSAYGILLLMPFGVSGTSLETYLSRVWIADPCPTSYQTLPTGGNFSVSAPGSLIDFATSDGGVLFTSTDSFLQRQYINLHQSNGYLYTFGDGSISVVSGVQTSGTPATTTFNYQTVDPQVGMSWRDSLQDFSRTIIFGNETGVYGLYGGAATKISAKLDQLFTNAVFPPTPGALVPTGASATIFNVKHYMLMMTVLDPDTEQLRNVMVTWNERDWVVMSQSVTLTTIGTQKVGTLLNAWGTDGNSVYPMFNQPSPTLVKRLDTKFYGNESLIIQKQLLGVWLQAQDVSSNGAGIKGTLTMVASGLVAQNHNFPSVAPVISNLVMQDPDFEAPYPFWGLWATGTNGQAFTTMGLRFSFTSPDFILGNLVLGYKPIVAFF